MAGLKETIARLLRGRRGAPPPPRKPPGRMAEVAEFGENPGALRMLLYRPPNLVADAALVVVLHGCTQEAEGYAEGAGWLTQADRLGFAVLAPEQTRANNPNLCFNWFSPIDVKRGGGEAASIRAMVQHAVAAHGLDPARVFVTGLSAGGAMTSAVLAAYPEVFTAGAVVAGLPCGAAANVQEAFAAMGAAGPPRDAAAWGAAVRAASQHQGPWPRVSIWHGDADATVRYGNAQDLTAQWTDIHGLNETAGAVDTLAGQERRTWAGADGRALVELVTVRGLGHGTPLAVGGPDGCGAAGPFLIEAGISSSLEIARFFGLTGAPAPAPLPAPPPSSAFARVLRAAGLVK